MAPPKPQARLSSYHAELQRLGHALAQRPHADERAILAGALLGAAGHLLRRSDALASDARTAVDEALRKLGRDEIAAWLTTASTTGLRTTLQRAIDAAFEAALEETDHDREGHREAALEGLAEREMLEGRLAAIARWEELHAQLDERPARRRDQLTSEARKLDGQLRSAAAALAPLNDERRAERDLLDASCRADAWWYSHHADRDDLVAMFTSPQLPAALAPRDPRAAQTLHLAEQPPRRHLSEDELWAYDLGTMNKDERSWVLRHAAGCPDCKRAIHALHEGEEALADALGEPRRAAASLPELDQEVALEHPQFRALVFRSNKKVRVVIEERSPGALLAVSSPTSLKPRRLRAGFEVQSPASGKNDAPALHLRVTLASREEVPVEVKLR